MEKRLDFIANGISDFGHFLLGLALQLVHLAFGLHFVITGDRSAGLLYTAFDFVNRSIGFLVLWGLLIHGSMVLMGGLVNAAITRDTH